MTRRQFQFREGKSSKFWTIEWDDDIYTVTYGPIGTDGRSESKRLASAAAVVKACEKLIERKLAKGYTESAPAIVLDVAPASDPLDAPRIPPESAVIDVEAMRDVLGWLEAPPESLATFSSLPDDPAWRFAEAAADAPSAIMTDWRFSASDLLNDVWQRLFAHGVKAVTEEEDAETGYPRSIVLQVNGIGSRYRISIRMKPEKLAAHDVLFALNDVLPKELLIFSLVPYEETDTYVHLIQPRGTWLRILDRLGPSFWRIFTRQKSTLTFTRKGGDIKPKRDRIPKSIKAYDEWLKHNADWHAGMGQNIASVLEKRTDDMRRRPKFSRDTPARIVERDTERFVRDMADHRRFKFILTDLEFLAVRILTEGTLQLLRGDNSGWPRLHLSLQYHFCELVLTYGHNPKHTLMPNQGGRLLSLGWALGDTRFVDWMMRDLFQNPSRFSAMDFAPLEPFLVTLYGLWKGIEIPWSIFPKAKLGVYQPVFNAWNDPARLGPAIQACCDYHSLRTGESGFHSRSSLFTVPAGRWGLRRRSSPTSCSTHRWACSANRRSRSPMCS